MKKLIACLTALLICVSLAVPAAAVEADFVPSISVKPAPEIVPVTDPEGNTAIAYILDADGNIIGYVNEDCLVVTPVSEASSSDRIPDDAEALLLDIYNKLSSGEMSLPYEEFGGDLDELNMIIRDLFDATWLCDDHPVTVAPEGVTVQITFDLGVEAGKNVYAMTYLNDDWNPVVSCVNNGDGTVTCTFEELCPIVFSVEGEPSASQTGDLGNAPLWGLVALAALAAIVVLTVIYRKDAMKKA